MSFESPRKIGEFVRAFETSIHNNCAFLAEFEKVAEELDQMGKANYNLKAQLKKAIDHNNRLKKQLDQINEERKEATKAFESRSDDTQMLLVANEEQMQKDKAKIANLASVVKRLQNEILADKKTQEIQADEIKTKDTELGQADADRASKDKEWEQKLNREKQEKQAAIESKLEFQRQMTEKEEEIINLREKIAILEGRLDKQAIALVDAKEKGQAGEFHKVNIKY